MTLALILVFSLLAAAGALIGGGILLAFPRVFERLRVPLLAYAVGTLLAAAFVGLLPDAIERLAPEPVLYTVLGGFLLLFAIEKFLRLPHFHPEPEGQAHGHHVRPAGGFVLLGDAIHNFVDGIIVATAFMVSIPLGIVTAFAVLAHEIPQELGDFVVLIESGWPRWRAYWSNFVASLAVVPGALLAVVAQDALQPVMPFLLALAAASFLYIAATDLAPSLHHETALKTSALQFAFMGLGVATLVTLHGVLG